MPSSFLFSNGNRKGGESRVFFRGTGQNIGNAVSFLAFCKGVLYNDFVCKNGKEGNHNAIGIHY